MRIRIATHSTVPRLSRDGRPKGLWTRRNRPNGIEKKIAARPAGQSHGRRRSLIWGLDSANPACACQSNDRPSRVRNTDRSAGNLRAVGPVLGSRSCSLGNQSMLRIHWRWGFFFQPRRFGLRAKADCCRPKGATGRARAAALWRSDISLVRTLISIVLLFPFALLFTFLVVSSLIVLCE